MVVVAQDMWWWWRRICGGGGAGYVVLVALFGQHSLYNFENKLSGTVVDDFFFVGGGGFSENNANSVFQLSLTLSYDCAWQISSFGTFLVAVQDMWW